MISMYNEFSYFWGSPLINKSFPFQAVKPQTSLCYYCIGLFLGNHWEHWDAVIQIFYLLTNIDPTWPYILVCCYGRCLLPGYSSSQVLLLAFHPNSKAFHFSNPFSKDTAFWSSIKHTLPIQSTTELSFCGFLLSTTNSVVFWFHQWKVAKRNEHYVANESIWLLQLST